MNSSNISKPYHNISYVYGRQNRTKYSSYERNISLLLSFLVQLAATNLKIPFLLENIVLVILIYKSSGSKNCSKRFKKKVFCFSVELSWCGYVSPKKSKT